VPKKKKIQLPPANFGHKNRILVFSAPRENLNPLLGNHVTGPDGKCEICEKLKKLKKPKK